MAMTFLEILEYGGVGMDFSKCNMAIKTYDFIEVCEVNSKELRLLSFQKVQKE